MSQKSYDGTPSVYLIPTPIGNMEDITLRAISTLEKVDLLFCEDTRVTGQLLNHLNIKKKMISSHNYNEEKNIEKLKEALDSGLNVGIVTDRGTPIISDPGYSLVKEAIKCNYAVIALPGATAFVPALISSGLSPAPFTFIGFLNAKSSKRKKELEEYKNLTSTLLFYESPNRILETLEDMENILGNRNISISREISKLYEEIYRGKISEVKKELENVKGEIVIVVEGKENKETYEGTVKEHVQFLMDMGYDKKEALKEVAKLRGLKKGEVYKEVLKEDS